MCEPVSVTVTLSLTADCVSGGASAALLEVQV